ncbi:PKD domain-containing protein, partial [Vibrio sp.]|uniref:PKD domain-containing protein n=1 Tax=Vibrio sp. TaxID=678 RepID=UPI003D12BB4C
EKYKGKLFVGGSMAWEVNDIPNTQYLAYYDSTGWNGIEGGQCWGKPIDFLVYEDTLFLAGEIGQISNIEFGQIAAYHNGEWIHIGDMNCNFIYTLEVFNDTLYAGGNIGLRKRTGATTWENIIPSGNYVRDMVVDSINNLLYVAGYFTNVGNVQARTVAYFDGFKWHSTGVDVIGEWVSEHGMAIYRGDLYAGGWWDEINEVTMNRVTRFDGENWHPLGWGCDNTVRTMAVYQDTLIVGGYFHQVYQEYGDSLRAYALAKWYMPDTGCNYIRPLIHSYKHYSIPKDTFYLNNGQAEVHFYNNNAYADSWQWDFGDGGTSDVQEPVHTYTDTGEYEVSVTVTDDGCEKTASKTVHIRYPVGIDDKKLPVMSLYPNPTEGNFILELENNALLSQAGKLTLEVSNMQGQHVYSTAIHQRKTTIPSSTWPRGTYICKLYHTGNLLSSDKMVLE